MWIGGLGRCGGIISISRQCSAGSPMQCAMRYGTAHDCLNRQTEGRPCHNPRVIYEVAAPGRRGYWSGVFGDFRRLVRGRASS